MKSYTLVMLSELATSSIERTIEAENDNDAIRKAEDVSDTVPRLICMDMTGEKGNKIKHW